MRVNYVLFNFNRGRAVNRPGYWPALYLLLATHLNLYYFSDKVLCQFNIFPVNKKANNYNHYTQQKLPHQLRQNSHRIDSNNKSLFA